MNLDRQTSISIGLAASIIFATGTGGLWLGRLENRVSNVIETEQSHRLELKEKIKEVQEESQRVDKAQWERFATINQLMTDVEAIKTRQETVLQLLNDLIKNRSN